MPLVIVVLAGGIDSTTVLSAALGTLSAAPDSEGNSMSFPPTFGDAASAFCMDDSASFDRLLGGGDSSSSSSLTGRNGSSNSTKSPGCPVLL